MQQKVLIVLLASLFSIAIIFGGCPKPIGVAYKTVVGSKAFLDSVKASHPECTKPENTNLKLCVLLVQATSAKDLLIDAGEIFCGGQGFEKGGACNPPSKGTPGYQIAVDKLNAAIQSYEQIEKNLKGVL